MLLVTLVVSYFRELLTDKRLFIFGWTKLQFQSESIELKILLHINYQQSKEYISHTLSKKR
jgi:hypothetical protein